MDDDPEILDEYPITTVVVANACTFAIWVAGVYVISVAFGLVGTAAYIAFFVALEVNLQRKSCTDCCYYGKTCFSGRGRVCAKVFRRGEPGQFASRNVSWKDIVPDMAVSFVPIACGVGLLISDFSWPVLAAVITLLLLSTMGSALVRGRLACRHCRQRVLGCPAERLFRKGAKGSDVAE